MKHIVTRSTYRGHRSAQCTCGLHWSPIGYDGGIANRQSNAMIRHMRQDDGKFADSWEV